MKYQNIIRKLALEDLIDQANQTHIGYDDTLYGYIRKAAIGTNPAEAKPEEKKPEEKKTEPSPAKIEEKKIDEKKPEEKKLEEAKPNQALYVLFSKTPAGAFNVVDEPSFMKAVEAVASDIRNVFRDQPEVETILKAFRSTVSAKDANELKRAFDLINLAKSKNLRTEKKAVEIAKKFLK